MPAACHAILLGGTMLPTPFHRALQLPPLCLPLGAEGCVLTTWLDRLSVVPELSDVRVILRTEEEVRLVLGAASGERNLDGLRCEAQPGPVLKAFPEPAAWRGVAGLLRDIAESLPEDATLLVIEANQLPPRSLAPMVELPVTPHDAVIGARPTGDGELSPAGVYVFHAQQIHRAPDRGYCDLKEQLLPRLYEAGVRLHPARLDGARARLADREGCLAAVRASLGCGPGEPSVRVDAEAAVSHAAMLEGVCIVEDGAIIEAGAVVQDSVIMRGATVGADAVVSQSILGPLSEVDPGERLIRALRGAARGMEREGGRLGTALRLTR